MLRAGLTGRALVASTSPIPWSMVTFVRSFAHTNSGHGGGTHWVMTGYDDRAVDNGGVPSRPSIGSIVSRARGANNPYTGMPTYVRMGGITADGPSFLGTAFGPFDPGGQARRNMALVVDKLRLDDRRGLLREIDTVNREADRTPSRVPQRCAA